MPLDLDRAELRQGRPEINLDLERTTQDRHDRATQLIFGAGLRLQNALGPLEGTPAANTIRDVLDDLDGAIRELRGVALRLESDRHTAGIRGDVLALVIEMSGQLGFQPQVVFNGQPDIQSHELHQETLEVLREMLSNVHRHAQATAATVELTIGPTLVLQVTDNGAGLATLLRPGRGLTSMQDRVWQLGGSFYLRPDHPAGAVAVWSAPTAGQQPT